MSNTLRNLGLAALFAVSASAFLPGQASALSSHDCSVKYKAAKAADPNTPAWNDFRKANCGADAAAAPDATAPAATPAATKTAAKAAPAAPAAPVTPSGSFMADCSANWKAMKAAKTTPAGMDWKAYLAAKCPAPAAAPAVTTAAATAPADGAKMSMAQCSAAWKIAKPNAPAGMTWNTFRSAGCVLPGAAPAAATTDTGTKMSMTQCSAAWKAAKAANTVPAGMTWNSFRSAGCSVTGTPAAATTTTAAKASIAPPEPTTVDNTPIKTVDKNGKPLSAGQIAAIKRIRACGAQWQQLKAANKIPAQIASLDSKHQWPQYWSMCNKQLKAKGM